MHHSRISFTQNVFWWMLIRDELEWLVIFSIHKRNNTTRDLSLERSNSLRKKRVSSNPWKQCSNTTLFLFLVSCISVGGNKLDFSGFLCWVSYCLNCLECTYLSALMGISLIRCWHRYCIVVVRTHISWKSMLENKENWDASDATRVRLIYPIHVIRA